MIPGVLILKRTYGRREKDRKLLYKCISKAGSILLAYDIPYAFSKVFQNLYVVYTAEPGATIGQVIQIIGPVDILSHFYEYQLYCKGLFVSNAKINKIKQEPITIPKSRENIEVFTIDPAGCLDFDDAFSARYDEGTATAFISIHIANVAVILNQLNAWSNLTDRVATLYMPDKKHSMLPTWLSEGVCSLKQGEDRAVFSLHLEIQNEMITKYSFTSGSVHISRNYVYEEPELFANKSYQILARVSGETDSHKVVEYFMTKMNFIASQNIVDGIFRRTSRVFSDVVVGEYCGGAPGVHEGLGLASYLHITSPIRRLVDLLNMIKMNESIMSADALAFYERWRGRLPYINEMTRAGKKVQNDCSLLHLCLTDESVLEKTYSGTIVDKIGEKMLVYISEIRFTNTIKREDLKIGDEIRVKLFLFEKENSFKKKIRLMII